MGQLQFRSDTLTYYNRIGGKLDSVDIANAITPSSFNGGRALWGANALNAEMLYNDRSKRVFDREPASKPIYFSALPHIGFAYSFGAQSSQFLRAEYQQAFGNKTLLNMDIYKNRGAGYLRNSSYDNSELNVSFQHKGSFYGIKMNAFYYTTNVTHNGGVTTDSLIEDFGLVFTPVNKANAQSTYKSAVINAANYFDLIRDSSSQFGLITKHNYSIFNRVYTEADTIYGLYNIINIDSLSTRDQYNLPSIRTGAGLFIGLRDKLYADVSFDHRYWKFQNLGVNRDTTEYYVNTNLLVGLKHFYFSNETDINLIGAYKGLISATTITYKTPRLNLAANLKYDGRATQVMNREVVANNYNYYLSDLQTNKVLFAKVSGVYQIVDSMLNIGLTANWYSMDRYYLFDGVSWRNDTLQGVSFSSIAFDLGLTLGKFGLRSKLIVSNDDAGYLPGLQSYTRLYLKTKVFKAKKLELLFGVEPEWSSSFRMRSYLPYADMMYWLGTTKQMGSLFNLNAFFGLKIDEFRFYLRYENIGYFWNDKKLVVLDGYPIASQRFRIGLTWDFFN